MDAEPEIPSPPAPKLRGMGLARRLAASVLLTPVGLVWLFFNTEITGSPGSTQEAGMIVWWLEPFRQLRTRPKMDPQATCRQ